MAKEWTASGDGQLLNTIIMLCPFLLTVVLPSWNDVLDSCCSLEEGPPCPPLVGGEEAEWAAANNLDAFFARIYRWVGRHRQAGIGMQA